jgi:glycosyltransferase involved in cell wall biosynthesis
MHHSGYSGYDRILDYLEDAITIPSEDSGRNISYTFAKFIGFLTDKNKGEYNSESVIKEIELYSVLRKFKKEKRIIHYLNAERDIRFLVNNKSIFKNASFIGTFHKPNTLLKKQIPNTKYLKKLDGALCVGPNQVSFIKNWLDLDYVKFIPHGIDTDFFVPDFSKREEQSLIFVGQHLRDFESFNYCIPKIAEKIHGLKVNVIIHRSYKRFIEPHRSIKVYSDIDDAELKDYYQKATALFLPLLDSTACNSILEAMAAGLPIISSDVGGNYGYVTKKNAILVPKGDNDFLIDSTIELLKNHDKIEMLGKFSRKKALEFDWINITKKINDFYNQVFLSIS